MFVLCAAFNVKIQLSFMGAGFEMEEYIIPMMEGSILFLDMRNPFSKVGLAISVS
jgi:hypothetical protein